MGAGTGAVTGAASNTLTTIGNNLLSHNDWNAGLKSAALNGALWGGLSGAISGGIKGFRYAKDNKVNPWNNNGTVEYSRDVKSGVPKQLDPTEYCYGHSAAYADAGHGNHLAEEFIAANGGAAGGDVSVLESFGASFVDERYMDNINERVREIGGSLLNPRYEMMAALPGEKRHWVNVFKITVSNHLSLFGGKSSIRFDQLFYWDPATGLTGSSTFFDIIKVYKY